MYTERKKGETKMTKVEMIKEMKAKGYATQYSVEEFAEMFSEKQIARFYEKFMEFLGNK